MKLGLRALGTGATDSTLCPLGQPEKAIDHESLIEPWLAPYNRPACLFQTPNGVVTTTRMKPLGWKKQIDLSHQATSRISGAQGQNKSFLHYVGWKSENIRPQEKYFFLTSPFIELHRTWPRGAIATLETSRLNLVSNDVCGLSLGPRL